MKVRNVNLSTLSAVAEGGAKLARNTFARRRIEIIEPRQWAAIFEENLLNGILPFWTAHAVDEKNGGIINWLDRKGDPVAPGDKALVVQSRVMWLFSKVFQTFPDPVYRKTAAHAREFLRDKLRDDDHGGYFWKADDAGRVVESKKHVYGQCFAIFGLAEYARAFNDEEALQDALEVFELVERKAHDDANGSYHQAYTSDWKQLLEDDQTFGTDQMGGKHQCAQTSFLEALTTLYDVSGNAQVEARLHEILDLALSVLVDEEHGHSFIHLGKDWSPINVEFSSYGHDIKLSWLITETARLLGRSDESKVRKITLALANHTLRDGFDHEFGGVYWEGPAAGPATQKQKAWWVQAEALMGLLNAYELTREPHYWIAFEQQARYVLSHMVDDKYGEWFEYGDLLKQAVHYKATNWKEPYHQGRACLEIMRRLNAMTPKESEALAT